jgi:hypothetical protein
MGFTVHALLNLKGVTLLMYFYSFNVPQGSGDSLFQKQSSKTALSECL